MRRFYLENDKGERRSLQTANLFFCHPDGLGYADSIDYFESEYGFFNETNRMHEQPNIVGDLVFFKDHYNSYKEFVDWVYTAGDLKLIYQPTAQRELIMDVDMERQSLSEKTPFGTLETPVSFRGKAPFYSRNRQQIIFENELIDNLMQFNFDFPFVFSQTGKKYEKALHITGQYPAAFELFINGPCHDPVFKVQKQQDGKLCGLLNLAGISLKEGEIIHYSSKPNAAGIWKVAGEHRENMLDVLDLSNDNFFRVPHSIDVLVSLAAEIDAQHQETVKHHLTLHEYFRG